MRTGCVSLLALVTLGCGGKSPATTAPGDGGLDVASAEAAANVDAPARADVAPPDGAASPLDDAAFDAPHIDDATPLVTAQYRACVAYYRAECNRIAVCGGGAASADPCAGATDSCPDSEFAAGSLRTVETLVACAAAWATFPCAQLGEGAFPVCAGIAGTLALGAPCTSNVQCASTLCGTGQDSWHPSCGVCAARAVTNGPCATAATCPYGDLCTNGKCVPAPVVATKTKGQACVTGDYCVPPTFCLPAAGGGSTCQDLPTLGQSCAATDACGDGSVCATSETCERAPTSGMPCARVALTTRFACDATSSCDDSVTGTPMCVALTPVGGACGATPGGDYQGPCAAGLTCGCVGGGCAQGTCLHRRQEGEACGDGVSLCVPGTTCSMGTCSAVLQNTMTFRCGP